MCEVMGIRPEDSCEGIIGFINAQEMDTHTEQYLCDGFDLYSSMIDVYEE